VNLPDRGTPPIRFDPPTSGSAASAGPVSITADVTEAGDNEGIRVFLVMVDSERSLVGACFVGMYTKR
jgi:hypothetical protein